MIDMYVEHVERFELPVLWAWVGGKHGNSSSLHPCTSAVHEELISFDLYFGDNLSSTL